MTHILTTGKLEVTNILKKTKAKLFQDLTDGDVIEVTLPIDGPTYGYAVGLIVKNIKTGFVYKGHTISTIGRYLDCFEWKSV
jgi:hypothetical protein